MSACRHEVIQSTFSFPLVFVWLKIRHQKNLKIDYLNSHLVDMVRFFTLQFPFIFSLSPLSIYGNKKNKQQKLTFDKNTATMAKTSAWCCWHLFSSILLHSCQIIYCDLFYTFILKKGLKRILIISHFIGISNYS